MVISRRHAISTMAGIVAAIGVAHFVKPEWVKPGAAVLDVGITRVDSAGGAVLVGDVDPAVAEVAGYL